MRNKTITGKIIEATPNYSARTYTIRRKDENGKTWAKYRTIPLSKEEFESMEFDTANDWANFLRRCGGDYYKA